MIREIFIFHNMFSGQTVGANVVSHEITCKDGIAVGVDDGHVVIGVVV